MGNHPKNRTSSPTLLLLFDCSPSPVASSTICIWTDFLQFHSHQFMRLVCISLLSMEDNGPPGRKNKVGLILLLSHNSMNPPKDRAASRCGFYMATRGFSCHADVAGLVGPSKNHALSTSWWEKELCGQIYIRAVTWFCWESQKKRIKLINSELSVRTGSFLLLHLDFFCKEFLRKVVKFQACLSPGKPYSSKLTFFCSRDILKGQYLNIFW